MHVLAHTHTHTHTHTPHHTTHTHTHTFTYTCTHILACVYTAACDWYMYVLVNCNHWLLDCHWVFFFPFLSVLCAYRALLRIGTCHAQCMFIITITIIIIIWFDDNYKLVHIEWNCHVNDNLLRTIWANWGLKGKQQRTLFLLFV